MSRSLLAALVLAAAAASSPALAQDLPPDPPAPKASPSPDPNAAPLEISAEVGMVTTTTSEAGTVAQPTGFIEVEGPLVLGHSAVARIGARLGLTSAPGQTFDQADFKTWRALEVGFLVDRVIGHMTVGGQDITTALIAEAGFASRLKGAADPRPLDRLVRSYGAGLRFQARGGPSLTAEYASDEATGQGAALILYGRAPIHAANGAFVFFGDVSIAIGPRVAWAPRRDVERIGLVVLPTELVQAIKGKATP